MCFLETGGRKATYMVFDDDNRPQPPKPSVVWHAAKWAFNRANWSLLPTGRIRPCGWTLQLPRTRELDSHGRAGGSVGGMTTEKLERLLYSLG